MDWQGSNWKKSTKIKAFSPLALSTIWDDTQRILVDIPRVNEFDDEKMKLPPNFSQRRDKTAKILPFLSNDFSIVFTWF